MLSNLGTIRSLKTLDAAMVDYPNAKLKTYPIRTIGYSSHSRLVYFLSDGDTADGVQVDGRTGSAYTRRRLK